MPRTGQVDALPLSWRVGENSSFFALICQKLCGLFQRRQPPRLLLRYSYLAKVMGFTAMQEWMVASFLCAVPFLRLQDGLFVPDVSAVSPPVASGKCRRILNKKIPNLVFSPHSLSTCKNGQKKCLRTVIDWLVEAMSLLSV